MSKSRVSVYIRLERKIASGGADDVIRRWLYGREVLKLKAGRRKLPDGVIDELVREAERAGLKVSRREIQYRVRCAEVYASKEQLRKIVCTIGGWSEIIAAGFPPITADEPDLIDEIADIAAQPDWTQPLLIPGLKHELKINKRAIPIEDAKVADGEAYEQMVIEMHEGFGKTVAQVSETMHIARLGAKGDHEMKLVEAYERGLAELKGDEADEDAEPPP